MDPEMVARTIQLIIAPAVMITACCIFGAGLLAHYTSIGERLRLIVRERIDLLREAEGTSPAGLIVEERLDDIDDQIPNLLRHHSLIRTSLAGTLFAAIFYILDMFIIAISVLANRSGLYSAIVVVFMLGVASQFVGLVFTAFDAFLTHRIYTFESRHAMLLDKGSSEHTRI